MHQLVLVFTCVVLLMQQGICEDSNVENTNFQKLLDSISYASSDCKSGINTETKTSDERRKETNQLKHEDIHSFLYNITEYINDVIKYFKGESVKNNRELEKDLRHRNQNVADYGYKKFHTRGETSDGYDDHNSYVGKSRNAFKKSVTIITEGHTRKKTNKKTRKKTSMKTKPQTIMSNSTMQQGKPGTKGQEKSRLMQLLDRAMFHNARLGPVLTLISTLMMFKILLVAIGTFIVTSLRLVMDFTR